MVNKLLSRRIVRAAIIAVAIVPVGVVIGAVALRKRLPYNVATAYLETIAGKRAEGMSWRNARAFANAVLYLYRIEEAFGA